MLEIKTQRGDLLIGDAEQGTFPAEHVAQCQGALWVAERDWIDICVYWPKMPVFIQRAYRGRSLYLAAVRGCGRFNTELGSSGQSDQGLREDGGMSAALPLFYRWDGESFTPVGTRGKLEADRQFVIGQNLSPCRRSKSGRCCLTVMNSHGLREA